MELQELKSLIRKAFENVEYPGDDSIAGCSRIGCDDCDPLAAHFKGTTWQEHSLQTLAGYADIGFLYPEARRYYLPAYMLAELEGIEMSEEEPYPLSNLDISWSFSPSEHELIQENHKNFVRLFSPQQRRAVIEYLKFFDTFEGVYEPDKDTLEAIEFLENG